MALDRDELKTIAVTSAIAAAGSAVASAGIGYVIDKVLRYEAPGPTFVVVPVVGQPVQARSTALAKPYSLGLGYDLPTPMGPVALPVDQLAIEAFDAAWPRMQERLREEMKRERTITFALVGAAVAVVLGANALLARRRQR